MAKVKKLTKPEMFRQEFEMFYRHKTTGNLTENYMQLFAMVRYVLQPADGMTFDEMREIVEEVIVKLESPKFPSLN